MKTPKDTLLRIEVVIGVSEKVPGKSRRKITERGLLNMSRSALYAAIARGEVPPPIKIGSSSFWRESEIMAVVAGTYQRDAEGDSA